MSTVSKFRNKTSCVYEEDDYYLENNCPFKRSHLQVEKHKNLVVASDHIIFKGNSFMWRKRYGKNYITRI